MQECFDEDVILFEMPGNCFGQALPWLVHERDEWLFTRLRKPKLCVE